MHDHYLPLSFYILENVAWICDLGMAVAIVKPLTVHVSITWLTAFQFITFTIGLGSAQMGHTTNDDQMFLCM